MEKQEMVDYLKNQFASYYDGGTEKYEVIETGFKFDVEAAIYWFASDYHSGQWSDLYSILSTSDYYPGMGELSPRSESFDIDENLPLYEMYESLREKYHDQV